MFMAHACHGSDGKKAFVGARDEFLECYKSAVLIAAVKREELAALKGIVIEVDPEAEMKQARPMCEYLEVLIDKYVRYGCAQVLRASIVLLASLLISPRLTTNVLPSRALHFIPLSALIASPHYFIRSHIASHSRSLAAAALRYSREQEYKPMSLRLDSLARFSAFCAACYVGEQVFLSPPELSALETLIDASADEGGGHTERYWRERFFKFLSKMREIKSVPKKEAKLHDRLVWKIN